MPQSPITQQALSQVAARQKQPQGGSSAVAALAGQAQEHQAQMQKLLQTIEKLQQENAQAVQQAAQAGGGAATQIANQVAAGVERAAEQSAREQERAEDKAFAIRQQKLNAELQAQARREATQMGEAIKAADRRYVQAVNTFKRDREDFDASITSWRTRLEQMAHAGKFDSPEGRRHLQESFDLLEQARIFKDNRFDDRHLQAITEKHNRFMAKLAKSKDPTSMLAAPTDPLELPAVQTQPVHKRVASPEELPPDRRFELKMTKGYPPEGLVFGKGLPEGYTPNIHPETMLDILMETQTERTLMDDSMRREFRQESQKMLVEAHDSLLNLMDVHKSLNGTYNQLAQQGVASAINDFLEDDDPSKFNDIGRYLVERAIAHTSQAGPEGEEISQIAMDYFDGKLEPKSVQEFYSMAAVEAITFNIKEHLHQEIMNAADPKKGGALATQIVNQLTETLGEKETMSILGVEPGAVGLVDAQTVIQKRLEEAHGLASRLNDGIHKFSLMEQFQNQFRSVVERMDLHSYRFLAEQEAQEQQLQGLLQELTGAEVPTDKVEGEGLQEARKNLESTMTMLDTFVGMHNEMGPDERTEIAAFITNHLDPVSSPNVRAYKDQVEVDTQRSPYTKAAVERSRFGFERHQRLKKQQQQGEQAAVGESFERGGVPTVVKEQLPPLIGLAGRGELAAILQSAVGLAQLGGGRGAARTAAVGARAVQGRLPAPTPSEARKIRQTLSPEEIRQILRESGRSR